MVMLSNGCICCQAGSDLALTVDALLAAERPAQSGPLRRIILETSGLSKPGSDPAPARKPCGLPNANHGRRHLRCNARDRVRRLRGSGRAMGRGSPHRRHQGGCRCGRRTGAGEGRHRGPQSAGGDRRDGGSRAGRRRRLRAAGARAADAGAAPRHRRRGPPAHRGASGAAGRRPGVRRSRGVARQSRGCARRSPAAVEGPGSRRAKRAADPRPERWHGVLDPSRPLGEPNSATPLFLVIIARDLEDAELDAVQPAGLFAFSSWAEPADMPRAGSLQSALVEWI